MNYPMRGKPSMIEINANVEEANRKLRRVDSASFEYGYWEGVRDERIRELKVWQAPQREVMTDDETADFGKQLSAANQRDKARTECSSCGLPYEWFELKPGDGRCNECAP